MLLTIGPRLQPKVLCLPTAPMAAGRMVVNDVTRLSLQHSDLYSWLMQLH